MTRLPVFGSASGCTHFGSPATCEIANCRHSLLSDWAHRGGIPAAMPRCVLAVAAVAEELGGLSQVTVGALLGGCSHQFAQQIEARALRRIQASPAAIRTLRRLR